MTASVLSVRIVPIDPRCPLRMIEPPRARPERTRGSRVAVRRGVSSARNETFFDESGNLAIGRKSPRLLLGVDQLTVQHDIEDAVVTLNQLRLYLVAEGLLQLGRQTGGLRKVVSPSAVCDLDVHALLVIIFSQCRACGSRIGHSCRNVDLARPVSVPDYSRHGAPC